jgi:hypothetical protein
LIVTSKRRANNCPTPAANIPSAMIVIRYNQICLAVVIPSVPDPEGRVPLDLVAKIMMAMTIITTIIPIKLIAIIL